MKSIYSTEHLAALKQEGLDVNEVTQHAHRAALENNAKAVEPTVKPVRKKDIALPQPHSVFYFPTIGPAVPVKKLGRGAYGKVKKIVNGECKYYAIKSCIFPDFSEKSSNYRAYLNECAALKLMDRFYGSGTRKIVKDFLGIPLNYIKAYTLTEFYDGLNALQFINMHAYKSEHISPQHALKICSSMVSELKQLHAVGLTHNDLKPENFMIIHQNDAKLIDFGDASNTGVYIDGGTIGYFAPETIKFNQQSVKSDIYALGRTFNDLMEIVDYDQYPGTDTLGELVEKMTEVNASSRPTLDEVDILLELLQITLNPDSLDQIIHPPYLSGFHLKTALSHKFWASAGILMSKHADISLYKNWHTLAEQSSHRDYLRALFSEHLNTPESFLRLYAMAVKQKIASLRHHTGDTLDQIIEHASPLEQARTILAAISTHGLKRRHFQETAWAQIAQSILIDFPDAAPQKTLLFSSCFKSASRDVMPVNLVPPAANINTLRPQFLNRNANI